MRAGIYVEPEDITASGDSCLASPRLYVGKREPDDAGQQIRSPTPPLLEAREDRALVTAPAVHADVAEIGTVSFLYSGGKCEGSGKY